MEKMIDVLQSLKYFNANKVVGFEILSVVADLVRCGTYNPRPIGMIEKQYYEDGSRCLYWLAASKRFGNPMDLVCIRYLEGENAGQFTVGFVWQSAFNDKVASPGEASYLDDDDVLFLYNNKILDIAKIDIDMINALVMYKGNYNYAGNEDNTTPEEEGFSMYSFNGINYDEDEELTETSEDSEEDEDESSDSTKL